MDEEGNDLKTSEFDDIDNDVIKEHAEQCCCSPFTSWCYYLHYCLFMKFMAKSDNFHDDSLKNKLSDSGEEVGVNDNTLHLDYNDKVKYGINNKNNVTKMEKDTFYFGTSEEEQHHQ